jgi:hypothetical protein
MMDNKQGMLDAAFLLLVINPYALISVGGKCRQIMVLYTRVSIGITFEKK